MTLDRKNVILLGVAVLSALLAAFFVRSWLASQEPKVIVQERAAPVEMVSGIEVLVASQDLPAGLIVTPEHLKWQQWPKGGLNENFITRETGKLEDYVGGVAREMVTTGEPVTTNRVVRPGDRGFLAAILSPGMRAITIPINVTRGIAGLLFPGDHVDLIVTHNAVAPDGNTRRVSETVMTNIRVLAIDSRLSAAAGQPALGSTITIEVTPKQVEQVIVAQQIGSFSLALRSMARHDTPEQADAAEPEIAKLGDSHTFDSDVSKLLTAPANSGRQTVVIMRGTSTSAQEFKKVSK